MIETCLYLDETGCPRRDRPKDFRARERVRTWHDRVRGDGLRSEVAGLLTRVARRAYRMRPRTNVTRISARMTTKKIAASTTAT